MMTKKQFKKAMRQGLGRCVLELRNAKDKERYRDIVLWGCTHVLSYDMQCEGTRADYLYELIRCFDDETPFVSAAAERFESVSLRNMDLFAHLCGVLAEFYCDGNGQAKSALFKKYGEVYCYLKTCRRKRYICYEAADFEQLCVSIAGFSPVPKDDCLRIAGDIGNLLEQNPVFTIDDFGWTSYTLEEVDDEVRNALTASSCAAVQTFLRAVQREKEDKSIEEALLGGENQVKVELRLAKMQDEATELTKQYLAEQDDKKRAKLLSELAKSTRSLNVFSAEHHAFSFDPETVIADSRSNCAALRSAAFDVLCEIKHEKVRTYALELIAKGEHISFAATMFAGNYRAGDYTLLEKTVKSIPVNDRGENNWHEVYSDVLKLYESGADLPKDLLFYLYENTLCSCCREYIVREIDCRGWGTDALWQECLLDSNENIRAFAENKIS